MNNKVMGIIAFAAGAAIGSVATWKVVKTKYEQIVTEEIGTMREYYNNLEKETSNTTEEPEEPEHEVEAPKVAEVRSYKEAISDNGYFNYSNTKDVSPDLEKLVKERAAEIVDECKNIVEGSKRAQMINEPYVIHPDDFDTNDYEVETLVCYADNVVTTYNTGQVLTDDEIEKFIGRDSLSHFGEFEDDCVFVRNDSRKTDYEILRDEDRYSD